MLDTAGLTDLVERLQDALRTQKAFGLTQKGDTCFVTIQKSDIELLTEVSNALGLGAEDIEYIRSSSSGGEQCPHHHVALARVRCEWSCAKCKGNAVVKETDLHSKNGTSSAPSAEPDLFDRDTRWVGRCGNCDMQSSSLILHRYKLLCERCAHLYQVLTCGHLRYLPGWNGRTPCDLCPLPEKDTSSKGGAGNYVDIGAHQPGASPKRSVGGALGYNPMCHRCGVERKIPPVVGKPAPDLCPKCASDLGICMKCGIAQKMPDTARGSLFRLCKSCYKRGMGYGVGRK